VCVCVNVHVRHNTTRFQADARFGTGGTNTNAVCHNRAMGQLADKGLNELLEVEAALLAASQKNLAKSETATLKWQYVGSENGWFSQFPASSASKCDTYDPRYRPWCAIF
jgi:hypothetical protein